MCEERRMLLALMLQQRRRHVGNGLTNNREDAFSKQNTLKRKFRPFCRVHPCLRGRCHSTTFQNAHPSTIITYQINCVRRRGLSPIKHTQAIPRDYLVSTIKLHWLNPLKYVHHSAFNLKSQRGEGSWRGGRWVAVIFLIATVDL